MKLIIELTESELANLEEITKSSFYGIDIDADVSDAISKLIKSQPSDDCISREEVIQIIENKLNPCTDMFKCLEMSEIKEDVEHLPPVTPKAGWIPCSERLPEVGSEVLVCFDFKGNRSVYISDFYGDGEFHGLDDEYLTPEGRKCRKAVAWMPLPEPYKAESEAEE